MAQLRRRSAVHGAVVRLEYGSLVRNRRADRQIPRSVAAENCGSATMLLL
jgi:hypothetical protein